MPASKDKKIITIIKLSRQAFGKYKLHIVVLTALGFLSGLLEGVGVNALIPLFSFIIGQDRGEADWISRIIEKAFLYAHIDFSIKYLLVFISLLFIVKALVLVLFSYINARIASGYERQTRINLFNNILKAGWPYLLKEKLGHLETVLMINIKNSSRLLGDIGSAIMASSTLIVYTLVAINISFYITLITLTLGLALFLVLKPFIYKARMISNEQEKLNKEAAHHVNENIIGMKTVKAMFVESKVAKVGEEYFNYLRRIHIKYSLLQVSIKVLMQPVSLIFICIIFAFSYQTPNFNFAALMAIIYLIKQIFAYFEQLQARLLEINNSAPYLEKVLEYEEQAKKYKEKSKGKKSFKFNDTLQFRDVNFSYRPGEEVLSGVNFSVKKGEMVGFIGSSGAGKTTIVDLLLRLFNPDKGEILIDGEDITEIDLAEWRKNIGYVSQDIFLKNDTIANNIKFYDNSISEKDIEEAARMANIYDFIQSCPKKFDTEIGERGVLLSGGQKQRIIIARVLARKPKLLILDEATSALDNKSEAEIQKVIKSLKGKVTVLIIAHRLSTVVDSDRLIILDGGKIIEKGAPAELIKNKASHFYQVYNIEIK